MKVEVSNRLHIDNGKVDATVAPWESDWAEVYYWVSKYRMDQGDPEIINLPPHIVASMHKVLGRVIKFYKDNDIDYSDPNWNDEDAE